MTLFKNCSTCGRLKALTDYNVMTRAADGRQARCRECCQAWYQENSAQHKKNVRRRNAAYRKVLMSKIGKHLLEHPCVDCGAADLRVLEFDHRDPSRKRSSIAALVGDCTSWGRLLSEIEKCDVRCSNCHRIRTGEQFGSWRIAAEADRLLLVQAEEEQVHADAVARLGRLLPRQPLAASLSS